MDCTDKVERLGNSPTGGNKLFANYSGADMPEEVNVKGTTDTQPLRGSSGNWISRDKYTSKAQTLVLRKGGAVVKECKYDENGDFIPALPPQKTSVSDFKLEQTDAAVITVSWTSVFESDLLKIYVIDRNSDLAENGTMPDGTGIHYVIQDFVPGAGTYTYVLKASLTDGSSDAELARATITI